MPVVFWALRVVVPAFGVWLLAHLTHHDLDRAKREWRTKRLLDALDAASGEGTSMITLILPRGFDISRAAKKLCEEAGTSANIKKNLFDLLAALRKRRLQV